MRSLDPDALMLDTELHTASALKWRQAVLTDSTARAAHGRNLISAALGRGGEVTWLWSRSRWGVGLAPNCTVALNDAGEPAGFEEASCRKQAAWFALSLLQSPRALDAHVRSSIAVQSHAAAFGRLGSARPRVWLLYSQHTARASEGQAEVTIALMEALAFLGATPGFVDADAPQLAASLERDVRPADWLLIPATTHVSLAALDAVSARLAVEQPRRTLAFVSRPHASLLSHDRRGSPYADAQRGAIPLLPLHDVSAFPLAADRLAWLEALLQPDSVEPSASDADGSPLRLVRCIDAAGRTAAGVLVRSACADERDDGRGCEAVTTLLANLRNVSVDVDIRVSLGPARPRRRAGPPPVVLDVLAQRYLRSAAGLSGPKLLHLRAGETRLLRLETGATAAQQLVLLVAGAALVALGLAALVATTAEYRRRLRAALQKLRGGRTLLPSAARQSDDCPGGGAELGAPVQPTVRVRV